MQAVEPGDRERREWEEEFEAAARRPLRNRLRYALIRTYKPVLDDEYRSFDSMAEYRSRWGIPLWRRAARSSEPTTPGLARRR